MIVCCRNEYAIFKQIKTETITVEGDAKKAKLFITLEKHPKFDENYEKFEKFKAETAPVTKQWVQYRKGRNAWGLSDWVLIWVIAKKSPLPSFSLNIFITI